MRLFQIKSSPILTLTYTGCNLEMRSYTYRRAMELFIGSGTAASWSYKRVVLYNFTVKHFLEMLTVWFYMPKRIQNYVFHN